MHAEIWKYGNIVLVECLLKNCYLHKQEILSAHNVRTIALNAFNFILYDI